MTEAKKALFDFWSQFGVPAYLMDQVPKDAQLPYITFAVDLPGFGGTGVLTAYNWHENEGGGNMARNALMDKIAAAIPPGGVRLAVGSGYVDLFRNDAGFQRDWQDPNDLNVIGGRTSYEVSTYIY